MKIRIPRFREQFSKLIATPSISCINTKKDMSNLQVIEMLATWLADIGFSVEIIPMQDRPEKCNLIAVAGKGEAGLVLAGHTDTVPYDESGWKQDPFILTETDNRFYGLGTSDMKCFFPIVLDVIRDLDIKAIKNPLYILATCDEESTMSGAKALVKNGHALGRYALIGEPTGLKPVNMHKGIMFESIKLIGQSGHSSDSSLGKNALEGMNRVISELNSWRSQLQKRYQNKKFKIPYSTLNFGSINGGDSPNRICGECEMKIDVRFLPDMDHEELRASLRKQVMIATDGTGLAVEFDQIIPSIPGMLTDTDSDIVRTAERLAGEPTGSVAFGTEGHYLNLLGMETVILGPGDIDVAHQANEYLNLNRIEPMKDIVKGMIKKYCM